MQIEDFPERHNCYDDETYGILEEILSLYGVGWVLIDQNGSASFEDAYAEDLRRMDGGILLAPSHDVIQSALRLNLIRSEYLPALMLIVDSQIESDACLRERLDCFDVEKMPVTNTEDRDIYTFDQGAISSDTKYVTFIETENEEIANMYLWFQMKQLFFHIYQHPALEIEEEWSLLDAATTLIPLLDIATGHRLDLDAWKEMYRKEPYYRKDEDVFQTIAVAESSYSMEQLDIQDSLDRASRYCTIWLDHYKDHPWEALYIDHDLLDVIQEDYDQKAFDEYYNLADSYALLDNDIFYPYHE